MANNILTIADGDYGYPTSTIATLVQGQYGQSLPLEIRDLAGNVVNLTGFSTLSAIKSSERGRVTSIVGTIALSGTPTVAPQLSWLLDEADTGIAGTFSLVLSISNGAITHETHPVELVILPNPAINAVAAPGVVGITTAQKALLATISGLTGLVKMAAGTATGIAVQSFMETFLSSATALAARANLLPSYTGNAGKVFTVNVGETDGEWSTVAASGSLDASTQSGVDKTGVSDSTAGLQNAITAAAALGHKTLYLPAGTYSITGASGVLMTLSSDGFKFVGDGAGKTIIKLADSRTLTNHLTLIRLTGVNQAVEGITINCGTGHTVGSYEIDAISIYTPAEYSTVSDVEIYNVAGGTSAGGVGVATYQPYNVNEGYQYAKLTNVVVRDSATATGFIINSNGNILTNCHALDVGNNSSRHGFYQQGGDNLYSGCRGERVGGYSFHMYKTVSNIDASGDKVIGCTSLDPVVGHLVVQGTTNSSNPDVPAGESLARYTIITSNVFKVTGTPPGVSAPVALNAQGVLFTNNVLEDAGGSAAIWVDTNSGTDCVVQSNIFRKLNSAITNDTLIRLGVRCIAEGNRAFLNAKSVAAFVRLVGVYAKSSNNCFYGAGGYVQIGANYVESFGDTVILTGSGNAINVSGSLTGAKLRNGHFECTGNTVQLGSVSVTFESCRFVGAVRYDSTGGTVRFINCVGGISYGGFLNQNLDERSGILGAYLNDGNAKTYRRLVTLTGGVLVATGTSDTTFVGIMPTSTGAVAYYFYIVDQPGAVCKVDTDAAWTAGNYGIVSPTVAGKIHDNGASPPASGSYVLFLDTGGSAGVSTVRLVKTI